MLLKKEERVTDFYDEEGNKVALDIKEVKRILLEKDVVVKVKTKLLDQNDLIVF